MAEIKIISRVIPRGGSRASAPSAGGGFSAPVDISGKLDKSVWNSAFELHYDDPDDPEKLTSIGAKTNFFSVGEISVFGKGGSSGGGGGATTLHMLEDVDLVMPIPDGDVLTYDAQKGRWTNKKGAGGIDTRVMWEELAKSDTSKRIHFSHIPDLGSVYAKQVKLGATPYNVSNGVVSLPAYPTALRSPNALTISLNGKSQGGYDGSSAKSINITPSSIGAALSSDLSKYVLKSGDTMTGQLRINSGGLYLRDNIDFGNLSEGAKSIRVDGKQWLAFDVSNQVFLGGSDIPNIVFQTGATKIIADSATFYPYEGNVNLGAGWGNHMWNSGWFTKIGCYVIGANPNDVHNDYNPWYGINFSYNNRVVMSGYHGIDFYTASGRVVGIEGNTINVVNAVASGEITAYSDARLKSCIKPLRNRGFITPVSYIKDGKESIGFIAQDMIELYPELVSKGSSKEHYLSVNYAQYTAVLQAQIIELHKEIDDLKRKFIN